MKFPLRITGCRIIVCARHASRLRSRPTSALHPETFHMAIKNAAFQWEDPLLLDQQLTNEERMVRDAANAYCQERLAPRVLEGFRKGETDPAVFREMGALGLLGPTIPEQYGGPGLNYVC